MSIDNYKYLSPANITTLVRTFNVLCVLMLGHFIGQDVQEFGGSLSINAGLETVSSVSNKHDIIKIISTVCESNCLLF